MSTITCHLSPTPTAKAPDPPPANSPTIHHRLNHQDSHLYLEESSNLFRRKKKKKQIPQSCPNLAKQKRTSFFFCRFSNTLFDRISPVIIFLCLLRVAQTPLLKTWCCVAYGPSFVKAYIFPKQGCLKQPLISVLVAQKNISLTPCSICC